MKTRDDGRQRRARAFPSLLFLFLACASSCRDAAGETPEATVDRRPLPTACRPPHAPPAFRLTNAFPGVKFDRPTTIVRAGATYFVGEQGGQIRRVDRDGASWRSELFLDIGSRLVPHQGEGGLIGFALSPDFDPTGEAFVTYTGKSDTALFRTVISRLTSHDGGRTIDPSTEEEVLSIERDLEGHNGGRLVFGPDRNLYIGIGDGSWGDPQRRAQNPNELFGKLLRIDVLGARPYASPPDNPFSTGGGRPEVYALGFRNPWSFSFDDAGRLWLGDVGHERWEEIDLVVKGGNYGWPIREARHCFMQSTCDLTGAVEPVHEYSHVDGFSVTGGLVYRGSQLGVAGNYIFGDFLTGRLWAIEGEEPRSARLLVDSGANISGFGEDEDRELLVLDYAGQVLRLERADAGRHEQVSLGQLGCLGDSHTGAMDPGLIPYEVNAQLWADGLDKRRWFAIPPQTSIQVNDEGKFELPPGSLLLKEFSDHGRRIETRMFVRDADFGWQGYTFEWNNAQTDALLLDDAKTIDVGGSPWTLPSRGQCYACHAGGLGRVLGFEAAQLNRMIDHGTGARTNQLTDLSQMGVFARPIDAATAPALADPYDTAAPIASRARAYLDANCSFCHGAAGTVQGLLDLRATVPLPTMNVICRQVNFLALDGDLGSQKALISPGDPAHSLLVTRMGRRDGLQMPPLGTGRVDVAAVDVVSSWVASLDGCP
jgi:uncharacterized repeat protein (TIGR03806 family)